MIRKLLLCIATITLLFTGAFATAQSASANHERGLTGVYCPHHDYKRHGGNVLYVYVRDRNGAEWHQHFYNRYAWNGARYVFTYALQKYCYRIAKAEAIPSVEFYASPKLVA